jgi:glutamine amidotransferase
MIIIIDYGMGNVGSILNMLKKVGVEARISSSAEAVRGADKLILPGVGAFDAGMSNLSNSGLRDALDEKVLRQKTPVLGVCLGMQLMTCRSEEGECPGLGWVDGETTLFRFDSDMKGLKIPHMGWNTVTPAANTSLFCGFDEPPRFYFVHSYHVLCRHPSDVVATVHHGFELTAAIERGNIMGVQFHPEKSHRFGMAIYRAFAALPSAG